MTFDHLVYQGRACVINILPSTADTMCYHFVPPLKKGDFEKQPGRDFRKTGVVARRELIMCLLLQHMKMMQLV